MSASGKNLSSRNGWFALAHVGHLGALLSPHKPARAQFSRKLNPAIACAASRPLPALLFWKITYESRRQILQSV